MKTKDLIIKASYVFANNGIRQITAVLVSIFIANLYGPQGRGEYVLFTSITAITSIILSLGIVNSLVYQIKHKLISVKQSVYILISHLIVGVFISLVSILALINFTDLLSSIYRYEIYQLIILYLLYFLVTPLSLFIAAYLLAIGDISAYRNYIILNCVAIIFGFLCVYLGKATKEIHPVVILVFVDTLVNFLIIKKIISNQIISPIRYHQLKTIYLYALKGYIAGLSSIILGRIENLAIPLLSNVYILGIYSIAKTFYNIVITIPTAFSGYIFGVFCDNERSLNIQICLKVMGLILILGLVFIVFSFYFIDHFLILVFGNDFSSAISPAKILVISAIVFGVSMPINSLMFAIGKPSVPSIIGVIGITSIIIMMFLLIPKYSIMGAAYSSLFGSVAITIMRCSFFMKLLLKEYR